MADQQTSSDKAYDPMSAFREMRDRYLDAWAKAMVETVNTDSYAKATGVMLDTYLTASSPFREVLENAMLRGLQQLNMPSRSDFSSLAERATLIEMKLDDLDARLERIEKLLFNSAARKDRTPGLRTKKTRTRSRKEAK
jgi:hypothetical protein